MHHNADYKSTYPSEWLRVGYHADGQTEPANLTELKVDTEGMLLPNRVAGSVCYICFFVCIYNMMQTTRFPNGLKLEIFLKVSIGMISTFPTIL